MTESGTIMNEATRMVVVLWLCLLLLQGQDGLFRHWKVRVTTISPMTHNFLAVSVSCLCPVQNATHPREWDVCILRMI